jgi:hypothetical protein
VEENANRTKVSLLFVEPAATCCKHHQPNKKQTPKNKPQLDVVYRGISATTTKPKKNYIRDKKEEL